MKIKSAEAWRGKRNKKIKRTAPIVGHQEAQKGSAPSLVLVV